ncbi:zinc finger HIT domain-containing protein 3 [Athalia rosae]|uniref:zinc finger HIT domain-containing protein 3 n=1 Tax=Athalia rosae TaxID=37344 RepID=UPI002034220A|nr:zinc finger HIT domain-containing protein 3 [Athalia rosae]
MQLKAEIELFKLNMSRCDICEKETASYKCPICRIPYCSVVCFKVHKTEPCTPPTLPEIEAISERLEPRFQYPTEDMVPIEKLKNLRHSTEVKSCLSNPHVRTIVQGILESNDPTEAIAKAMTEPIFEELADACLRVIEPQDEAQTLK